MDQFSSRSAGILMHISSLPSAFGIGDLGPEAFAFADFLSRTQQSYWQILPLNPTNPSQSYSPYSSNSSMAGNTMLISPESLMADALLTEKEITSYRMNFSDRISFDKVVQAKSALLKKAFNRFSAAPDAGLQMAFSAFRMANAYWLHDYSLYCVLKDQHNDMAWFQWPEAIRYRDPGALSSVAAKSKEAMEEIAFGQWIFQRQWDRLKTYCNDRNIRILGDLPFYVGLDSVDLWSNNSIFTADHNGNMSGVAGVPPDAFSDDGQMWGMPVYHWDILKKDSFQWWITRLKKNMELFDLLRIDHFRALSSYWVVPPHQQTAKKGKWKKAPGAALLKELRTALNGLPIVAEDLGEIETGVFQLRDRFGIPGMNVLHFAFGKDMPSNSYIPHHNIRNSVIYTGTHDNNTTRGWFDTMTDVERTNLHRYLGITTGVDTISPLLCRLAYSSVSDLAVLPIQDILDLGEEARMNTPGGKVESWTWRLDKTLLTPEIENRLREWCNVFDRRRDGDVSFATTSASL